MLDDATALATGQRAETRTAEAVVRAHQEELLRTAYLLTGDQARAATLAENACLVQLRPLLHSDDDLDSRARLLQALVACYLVEPPALERQPRRVVEPARYSVDDERDRIWAALELCDPPQRLALVLRDFNRLDEEEVATLARWHTPELRERPGAARTRLRDAAGVRQDHPTSTVLIALSLGAPRLDLWARLAGPVAQLEEHERRRRLRVTATVVGLVAFIALGGVVWLAGGWPRGNPGQAAVALPTATSASRPTPTPRPSATPTLPPLDLPNANVPDVQMIRYSYSVGTGTQQRWFAPVIFRDPRVGPVSAIDDVNYNVMTITPDGTRLVTSEWQQGQGSSVPLELVCRDAATGALIWKRVVPHTDMWVVFSDRMVAMHRNLDGGTPQLVAYDLADGDRLGSWAVETPEPIDDWSQIPIHLLRSPNEERLIVSFTQMDVLQENGQQVAIAYRAVDMTVEDVLTLPIQPGEYQSSELFGLWRAKFTPDGDSLYQYFAGWDGRPKVTFLDLESGALHDVELPLFAPDGEIGLLAATVTSHDGRRLFIINHPGEIAVVDLVRKRLERAFQLDTAGHAFPAHDIPPDVWTQATALFSSDGSRLYLADDWGLDVEEPAPDAVTAVWVIGVAQWRVVERWDVPGIGSSLLTNADGSRLYLTTRVASEPSDNDMSSDTRLYEIDTTTGATQRTDQQFELREPNFGFWVTSLEQLYRQAYGVTPAVAGVTPLDQPVISTLPLAELTVGPTSVAAGQQVRFTLRLVDPATRQSLPGASTQVRFDPVASVTLALSHPDTADLIVVPLQVETAVWEGTLPLQLQGPWSATVQVRYADGTHWSTTWPGIVAVAPSYLGSDGERYMFHLSITPATPVVDEPVRMQVVISNIEGGGPLPEGVEIEGGIPERIEVPMLGDGYKSVTLRPAAQGVYEAETTFFATGHWSMQLGINQPEVDGPHTYFDVGVLDVASQP